MTNPEPTPNDLPDPNVWWNLNLQPADHTKDIPEYLSTLNPHGQNVLSIPQRLFIPLSWAQCTEIINTNNLSALSRSPLDLRKYLWYMHQIKQTHGSVLDYVIKERIGWNGSLESIGGGFTEGGKAWSEESDWKILPNDWPYGLDDGIVHLVVWCKFEIPEEPGTDRLVESVRVSTDEFVREKMGWLVQKPEHLLWFKNWSNIKSIKALEHIHVLLYQPELMSIKRVIGSNEPLWSTVSYPPVDKQLDYFDSL